MKPVFHVVIPARFQSTRLPGKLLMDLCGQTILERVYRQALKASPESVTVATDHPEIRDQALSWGARVVMTDTTHQSGTDRIAEVVDLMGLAPDAIVVNVQGDEPLISPLLIQQVAETLAGIDAPMATLCWPLKHPAEYTNSNVVKVIRNVHQQALYFSRSPIPVFRDGAVDLSQVFRHIGLYAYRASFLLDLVQRPVCALEAAESLEQLRVLWAGYAIHVATACEEPRQDINTLDDLEHARLQMSLC
jgi:3-deoxy-manno-octulosonate cytidylyltransferase (CMP-KDO synthetase)